MAILSGRSLILSVALLSSSLLLSVSRSSAQQVAQTMPAAGTASNDSVPLVAGDVIAVHVFEDRDLDSPHLRVTDDGTVPILLAGPVKVAGLTPGQAADTIANAFIQRNMLKYAHVEVSIEAISSSAVTVYGYVNGANGSLSTTGMAFPLSSPKSLITVLAMAGGLSDRASHIVTIQHRGSSERITVSLPNDAKSILDNQPMIYPGDTIVVPRAGIVYVLGDVNKPMGVVMSEDGKLSLLQAITQAGSTLPSASLSKLMLFRKSTGQYQAIPVNLGKILSGKSPDIAMEPEDALWVPFSYAKNLLINGAGIAAAATSATATGLIYTH